MRTVAWIVLLTFSTVTISPGAQALAQATQAAPAPAVALSALKEQAPPAIERMQRTLAAFHRSGIRKADHDTTRAALAQLRSELEIEDERARSELAEDAQRLGKLRLSETMQQRHADAVARISAGSTQLHQDLTRFSGLDKTQDAHQAAAALTEQLQQASPGRPEQTFDPKSLPFGGATYKAPAPRTRAEQFAGTNLRSQAVTLAATDPSFLSETEDAQLTDTVRTLAAELRNDPVAIYNWVRNNIEYLPTHGSIQGSEITLQTRRGNAFDISSLLVALLRAAQVPARYVYGTVELPIDQVMNWVGGATSANAALDLLAQGGVPVTGLSQGGVIKTARMEHVWVEAYVDFIPSRGARNVVPDTWAPLDASFKQYDYTAGIDLKQAVPLPFDALTLLKEGANIDLAAGIADNLNQNAVVAASEDYIAAVEQYWANQTPPGTIEQLLGTKTIRARSQPVLAASLPYRVTARASSFAVIPSSLRHYIRLLLFNSAIDQTLDSPAMSQSISLPALSTRRLGVTYRPATAEDEALIRSYDGTSITRLPAYLIRLVPAIQTDGVDVSVGPAVTMGADQRWQVTLVQPGAGAVHVHTYAQLAGDEIVFGLNRNGVAPTLVSHRFATSTDTSAAESLHRIALYYWAEADLSNRVLGETNGVLYQRLPSVGVFTSPLSVIYSYGVPRQAFYKSRQVDISRSFVSAIGKNGASAKDFVITSGVQTSLLEGRVLEQASSAPQGSGISAVQLLIDAGNQGIPLYSLTAANASALLPQLSISSSVKSQISAAVAAGQTVVVSQRAPERLDWSGVGYIMLDPETGSGAYLIEGGLNGGELGDCQEQRSPLAMSLRDIVLSLMVLGLIAVIIAGSGGAGTAAAPAMLAIMAAGLGLTALTFPQTASAGTCGSGCHRGRIQAQGGGLQASVAWNQATPLTLAQGQALLAALSAQLTDRQRAERAAGFAGAARFMENAAASGGVCARDIKSSLSFPRGAQIRIDIEVREGQAFTP